MNLLRTRRSIHALGNKLPPHLTEAKVTAIIKNAIRESPSSHNSQPVRAVILYGKESQKVWQAVKDAMTALKLPEEQLKKSFAKVDGCFASGAGTVLFYDDVQTTKDLETEYPLYKANFPAFAQQAAGIAQFAVWIALTEAGLGQSLQHYNELIEDRLRAEFNIPTGWKLSAQMPFGSIEKPAGAKTYIEDEGRFVVRGTSKL